MLKISSAVLDAVIEQARQDHPIETCGVVAADVGSPVANRLIPMRNKAASETFFCFDPRQQYKVWCQLEECDQECRVIYHSHTASVAWPSREDIDHALYPDAHYLIVSTWEQADCPVRSFRISNGSVLEEQVVPV